MFVLNCISCSKKNKEKMERIQRENPDATPRELFGISLIETATGPVSDYSCPDCKVISNIRM